MKRLRIIRIVLEVLFFFGVTLLFLDFTGTLHAYLGWMAKVQFLPAVLALNVAVVVLLILLTLIFGRLYCSLICPLGVFQDIAAWFGKKVKKNRYHYRKPLPWVRYIVLAVFIILLVAGVNTIAVWIAPYSAWGRIVQSIFQPAYIYCNNYLATLAEQHHSYAFYQKDLWLRSLPTLIIAIITFIGLFIWAWRSGRSYCNTICPVGTVLGFLSRYSLFRPVINTDKCNGCERCARNCKASCIDAKNHTIDTSRCVTCFDCLKECKQGAIEYKARTITIKHIAQPDAKNEEGDISRRGFLTGLAVFGGSAFVSAQHKKRDGGLAVVLDKEVPNRETHIEPAGAVSLKHFQQHCTACQLCVAVCPNNVLRPSSDLKRLMQPEMSFERGYCRPECTKCSSVCPTGAITKITAAEKTDIHIGRAVWVKKNCIPIVNGDHCGACARRCPTQAITMVDYTHNGKTVQIPAINENLCIGCGKCENLCPARPFSAIYVEGLEGHHN